MTLTLKKPAAGTVPIHLTDRASFEGHASTLPAAARQWLRACGFSGAPDSWALVPGPDGEVQSAWAGVRSASHPYALSALPKALPEGRYRLGDGGLQADPQAAAMSWALGAYAFARYKAPKRAAAELMLAPGLAATRGALLAATIAATRDLVNTPAEEMARTSWRRR